jgi:hypothetical protein
MIDELRDQIPTLSVPLEKAEDLLLCTKQDILTIAASINDEKIWNDVFSINSEAYLLNYYY